MPKHRPWTEQSLICRAIMRGDSDAAITAAHNLSPGELPKYQKISADIERTIVRRRSVIRSYYTMQRKKPLYPVVAAVAVVVVVCIGLAVYLTQYTHLDDSRTYPLVNAAATLIAVAVAAVGWGVAGWISHRNAKVQHTINLVFTRFSQPTFVQHLARFNKRFKIGLDELVTHAMVESLEKSASQDDNDVAQSLKYILNYFEFIAVGVASGDLDLWVIENNIKSNLEYYFDKCEPLIREYAARSPSALEHYIRLRDHFREP